MAAESAPKASEGAVVAVPVASTKQRKKRKWDEPAEHFLSAGLILHGAAPLSVDSLVGAPVDSLNHLVTSAYPSSVPAACTTISQFQTPTILQNSATLIQKLNLPKIQDEVIAREIVINDAESSIRYRLTKRQTQEEIQRSTGAVVITRGKYRPPNSLPEFEKPLYLHISAGAHLKDTAGRIKAVDLAAFMVEEILKSGHTFQPGHGFPSASCFGTHVPQSLNTCVYLGFDSDPSLNIAARIRGPNDQYISHIMNVTGASVVLRGQDAGCSDNLPDEAHQSLHLFISSTSARSLEEARILAENLLDTIASECGVSRVVSSKVYSAVPPPQQLLVGIESSTSDTNVIKPDSSSCISLTSSPVTSTVGLAAPMCASANLPTSPTFLVQSQAQPSSISHPTPSITKATSYVGYGGIYPQATPLQQVAQALKNAPATTSSVSITTSAFSSAASRSLSNRKNSGGTADADHRPQRRKFQELPVGASGISSDLQNLQQESGGHQLDATSFPGTSKRDISSMPPPRKFVHPATNGMPPPPCMPMPPPRSTSPPLTRIMPPPPPKLTTPESPPKSHAQTTSVNKEKAEAVPDTLLKLMEYGDEDDDAADSSSDQEPHRGVSVGGAAGKPFWAV